MDQLCVVLQIRMPGRIKELVLLEAGYVGDTVGMLRCV